MGNLGKIGNINAGGGGVNRNVIINGTMNVAQRGTSATGLGSGSQSYDTVDRFSMTPNATAGRLTMEQAGTGSDGPDGLANCIKLSCTTADTSIAAGEILLLSTGLEGQNVQVFQKGKTDARPFAVSFYVKGNASATYVAELYDHDNTRQVSKTFNVTTNWSRVELSFPADTTGTFDDDSALSLTLQIWLHAGSTYGGGTLNTTWGSVTQANRAAGISSFFSSTSNTFFITGVQLEVGQNPTEFEHEPFERTLLKCQRYYYRINPEAAYTRFGIGSNLSTTAAEIYNYLPVSMRSNPSVETTGTLSNYVLYDSDDTLTATSIAIEGGNNDGNQLVILDVGVSSGLTDGGSCQLMANNNSSVFLAFNSEL